MFHSKHMQLKCYSYEIIQGNNKIFGGACTIYSDSTYELKTLWI